MSGLAAAPEPMLNGPAWRGVARPAAALFFRGPVPLPQVEPTGTADPIRGRDLVLQTDDRRQVRAYSDTDPQAATWCLGTGQVDGMTTQLPVDPVRPAGPVRQGDPVSKVDAARAGGRRGRQGIRLADVALALACLAVALPVQLSGSEAVAANRPVGVLSVLLTVAATVPLIARRRYPLFVLVATVTVPLIMVVTRAAVGLATLGPIIAFYTAVAYATRERARWAIVVMAAATAATALLRPVDLSAEGALVTLTLLVGGWVLGSGTRERRERHAADLVAAQQRAELERRLAQQERDRATQRATQERLRITRELHDVIGHAMSVMVVQAGVAERLLDTSPAQARQAIRHISATGRGSLTEMRRLLDVIREGDPDAPAPRDPAPTLADLPALLTRVTGAGLPVQLEVIGEPGALSPGQELALYRVVQEALTNCLKHAGASRADVHLRHGVDCVEVTVEDDGRSDGAPSPDGHGQGLAGMRERVAIYGGELSAGPAETGGFTVRAWLPVPSQ
jgi:signal transduction histidine kinase